MPRSSENFRDRAQLDIFSPMPRKRTPATDQRKPSLQVAGLFAGIGGIELGLHRSGHETSLLCELDSGARAVLAEHFDGVTQAPDVTALKKLPKGISLLTAGFPCQDLSQAGKTAGITGRNSGLVSHVFRLLETNRVPWVLLENVSFMLRLAGGNAMRLVVEELENLGYTWAYRVMDSRAFGLPQRRERVYVVACLPELGDPRDVLLSSDVGPPPTPSDFRRFANGFYWTEGTRGLGWAVDAVPTLKGGSTIGIASPPGIWLPDGSIVRPDIRDAERIQGFPADWTKPALERAKSGFRWKLVGNAVSVDAAEWLGQQLSSSGTYDPATDVRLEPGSPWPDAAWCLEKGERYRSSVSKWPVQRERPHLADFLAFPTTPLSERATAGFLSRIDASSLTFPDGFKEAIREHLRSLRSAAAVA